MALEGWYYLHVNGSLIYKRDFPETPADLRESDFVRALWPLDTTDRETAWRILVEGLAAGADKDRVAELAKKWNCSDDDGHVYAEHVGARLYPDGNQLCATRKDFVNLQESQAGFGPTAIESLAALAKAIGYRPAKMWGATFQDLLK